MANFKLYLLTPVNDQDLSNFIKTPLSIFNSQIVNNKRPLDAFKLPEQTFCYTYNEKVSFHQNGQKELSFSMDRKLLIDDNWTTNPFINDLKDNSIVLLEDKYNKKYIFVITKIGFTFKETNITYQYTCQDAFSYQNTRQNSGYTIENDPSTEDFIGPKTIDWWVIRKIVPECYIQYQYVPINTGLVLVEDTKLDTFTTEERNNWDDSIKRTIIKEPFDNEEYNTTLTFSCSNSNANAALIALGNELQLMIHTCEIEVSNGKFAYYFWYEPKQNQDVTGLTYSPKSQITNFGLTLSSNSLTTVLNVDSNEVNDEIITLLPSTPSFFTNCFMNTEEWENTVYSDGFFSNLIYGKKLFYTSYEGVSEQNNINISESGIIENVNNNNWLQLKIENIGSSNIKIPLLYDRFTTNWENNYYTNISYSLDGNVYHCNSKYEVLYLLIKAEGKTYIIKENEEIPAELKGKEVELYLLIKLPKNIINKTISELQLYYIYLTFYRLFSEEEKEFAEIADKCPWLENKLIDFTYFLKEGIISPSEYSNLMYKIQNDLRIVNGRLLYLTDTYYRALKEKTKIIASITEQLDELAAIFHSDVVTPLSLGKSADSISNFSSKYNLVFSNLDNNIPILDYNEIVSDYFEKYFNAEQKFLKNVYLFRKYFDEPCGLTFSPTAGIYEYTLQNNNILEKDNFVSFGSPSFTRWVYSAPKEGENDNNNNIFNKPVFLYENNSYKQYNFINKDNATNYYYADLTKSSFTEINKDYDYNVDYKDTNSYFLTEGKYREYFGEPIDIYVKENVNYCQLTESEIEKLILLTSEGNKYYVRDTNQYVPFDWVRLGCNQIKNILSWFILPNIEKYFDIENMNDIMSNKQSVFGKAWTNNNGFVWKYYKSFFPVSNIYYKGNKINFYSTTDKDNKTKYVIKKEQDISYQTIPFISNGSMLSNWGPCVNEEGTKAKEYILNNWSYYTLQKKLHQIKRESLRAAFEDTDKVEDPTSKNSFKTYSSLEGAGKLMNMSVFSYELDDYSLNQQGLSDFYRYDSYRANFFTTQDANINKKEALNAWNSYLYQKGITPTNNINGEDWMSEDYAISDESDKVWDTTQKGSADLYQYFNFYKYIAATYSFRRKFIEDATDNEGNGITGIDGWYNYCNINESNFFVKNKYLRILSNKNIVNKVDKYLLIPLFESTGPKASDWIEKEEEESLINRKRKYYVKMTKDGNKITIGDGKWLTRKFSSLTFYPLTHIATEINLKSISELENPTYTLEEVMNTVITNKDNLTWLQLEGIDNNGELSVLYYHKTPTSTSDTSPKVYRYYIVCHVEDYEKGLIHNSFAPEGTVTSYKNPDNYYINPLEYSISNLYSLETDLKIDPFSEGIITKIATDLELPIYVINSQDEVMVPVTKNIIGENFNNYHFYNKVDENNYVPIYTKEQVFYATQDANTIYNGYKAPDSFIKKICYINNSSYTVVDFTNNKQKFNPTLYLCSIERNGENITFKSKKSSFSKELDFNNGNTISGVIKDSDGKQYEYNFTKDIKTIEDNLSKISNGTLWYKYRNKIDWSIIFEAAASIETQLEVYWQQAYTASKYCKYFLPEHWQPVVDTVDNHFSEEIIIPVNSTNSETNIEINNVTLSSKYLPNVEIYINDKYSNFKYRHYLPKYIWKWNPTHINTFTSIAESEELRKQDNNNYISADKIPVLNNKGVIDVLNHFGTSLSDWEVVENGYTIYYYNVNDSSGTTWSELTKKVGSYSFDYFDGLYGMAYRIFSSRYSDRSIRDYEEALEQKRNIWNDIYRQYPFIMLEDNYKYDLATSSSDLLKNAELVFKSKKEPEKAYIISLLDINSLNGYKGQELFPGQGILLKANDYYDANDSIYNALVQYLFITDVSYNLRNDGDISITVNSIKYEEKLLQSLVKLIR